MSSSTVGIRAHDVAQRHLLLLPGFFHREVTPHERCNAGLEVAVAQFQADRDAGACPTR